jgi:polygalacturonase
MNSFHSNRRDLLRFSALGLGAVVGSALPDAHAASHVPSSAAGPGIFDVRAYGAVGDGNAVDSPAINKAIDAAAAAGGGTVAFPAGTWLSFSIHLKSHVGLYLAQGATIVAADSPLPNSTTGYNGGTYDAAEPNAPWEDYQDYGHNHWHNSLIWGEGITDISITGPGTIRR